MKRKPERRYIIIALMILLMASSIFVIGESLVEAVGEDEREGEVVEPPVPSRLAGEISGFDYDRNALDFNRASLEGGRTLSSFRARRAYEGGPPFIPHEIADDRSLGGKYCLTCHGKGGYVPKFTSYAPVTPHPDFLNCRQCHNPDRGRGAFRENTFQPIAWSALKSPALPTSPPPIPHGLRLRENCLACHAGPGAVEEIRTTHPERINCRQCHALSTGDEIWKRPGGDQLP